MLNFLRKSLSLEIENFVKHVRTYTGKLSFASYTKSAFIQSRNKIKPEVFVHLNKTLIQEFYTDNDASIKLWKGHRLLAVDGSRLTLPNTQELLKEYGQTRNQNKTGVVQARVSVLYDVLNKIVLEGVLTPLSVGELRSAICHLKQTEENDLIIYDRGYPSFQLIYEHYQHNVDFVIRAKKDFSNEIIAFYASGEKSRIIQIKPGKNTKTSDKDYNHKSFETVRLVRVQLPNSQDEILITSLLDIKKYPNKIFKGLYFQRWGVELFYDELKTKLKTEHFSGYSKNSILQDFYAALFVSNIQSLIVGEINDELKKNSDTKYEYKVNNNLSYGFLKDRIIGLFFSEFDTQKIFEELHHLFRKHLVPIRPNRSFDRVKDKYRTRHKPKVPKNMKDSL